MTTREHSQSNSLASIGAINFAMAIVGITQVVLIGRIFGISKPIEIYFAAVVLYQSVVSLLQTGQIVEIATPIYHQLKASDGAKAANDFFSALLNLTLIFSVCLTLLLLLVSPLILQYLVPGFNSENKLICLRMFQWIIPCLLLQVIGSLLSSWLAAEKVFRQPEFAKLCIQTINLLPIILLSQWLDAWVLVVCLWISNLLIAACMAALLYKNGINYSFALSDKNGQVFHVLRRLPNVFLYVGVTQLYSISLTAGLTLLPPGSLAVVSYARRMSSKLNGLLQRPVALVFFNHYSEACSVGSDEVRTLAKGALGAGFLAVTACSVVVLGAGFPGMCALWLSNEFPSDAIFRTYLISCALTAVTLASIAGLIYRKINMTHQLVRQQYLALTIIQACCAVYAYYFMPSLGFIGVVSIIVINPLCMAIASGLLLRITNRESYQFYELGKSARYLTCGFIAIAPLVGAQALFYSPSPDRPFINFAVAVFCGLIGTFVFFSLASFWKLNEARQVVDFGFKKLARFVSH